MRVVTRTLSAAGLMVLCTAGIAQAQLVVFPPAPTAGMTFSVDYQGPTVTLGIPDSFTGASIDEGSILTPAIPGPIGPNPATFGGPLPPPGTVAEATFPGGSHARSLGLLTGAPREVDALSYGWDAFFIDATGGPSFGSLAFSVDEFARGDQVVLSPFPSVNTEGALGAGEASADVFMYLGPVVPTPPGPGPGNVAVIDGDALFPFGGPGTGLIEPNPAAPGVPDQGDNLDAMDLDTYARSPFGPGDVDGLIFFSLDADFADPRETAAAPPNLGSAPANGFSGADVLVSFPGGFPPAVYISAPVLGLDLFGQGTDDLDALVINDTSAAGGPGAGPDGIFTPGLDSILFSVREGSAVLGVLDSLLGLPIEPGDVLTLPATPGGTPSIFIPAEALGLATLRSGTTGQFQFSDDLDALDVAEFIEVPEPTSIALIGLGGLALLRRRR